MKPGRWNGGNSAIFDTARQSGDNVEAEIARKIHEEFHLLQAVLGVTRALRELATAHDFENMSVLLKERERMLKMVLDMRDVIAPHIHDQKGRRELNARASPLLSAIIADNEALVGILQAKKAEILEKLQEAHKQKSVLTYSH